MPSPIRLRKASYTARALLREMVPAAWCRARLPKLLASIEAQSDRDEIVRRAAYYCRLAPGKGPMDFAESKIFPLPVPSDIIKPPRPQNLGPLQRIRDYRFTTKRFCYYADAREFLRYFDPDFQMRLAVGDVFWVPEYPTIVKARPIAEASVNSYSVLLNLNKIRHFQFVEDPVPFSQKTNSLVFRGKVGKLPWRTSFFEKHFGKAGFDLGDTTSTPVHPEWAAPRLTIPEQLRHKFVLSLEGNDVATNLKWIFSSDSLPVMPKPTRETWFQEGLLQPDIHYIEIRPDYSDVEEKIRYFAERPDLCAKMNEAEHEWVRRFADPTREKLVSLLVLRAYFASQTTRAEP